LFLLIFYVFNQRILFVLGRSVAKFLVPDEGILVDSGIRMSFWGLWYNWLPAWRAGTTTYARVDYIPRLGLRIWLPRCRERNLRNFLRTCFVTARHRQTGTLTAIFLCRYYSTVGMKMGLIPRNGRRIK